MLGAVEAGGTKFICGAGTGPADLETIQIPTTGPRETTEAAIAFLREHHVTSVGIGSFGPVDLASGRITTTPKTAWRNFDLAGCIRAALGVPVAFETDVNAAALGEWRWGAGRGVSDFVYVTVGTGIGGGALVNGKVVHGLSHPEMGHVRIPHDRARDPFLGVCPFHGDCLEGLASGPAIEARWGLSGRELPPDHEAWALEARYLALGLANWICVLSPKVVILGGGVAQQERLLPMVKTELAAVLNGYLQPPQLVRPQLGGRAGVLGALALAETAGRLEQAQHAVSDTMR